MKHTPGPWEWAKGRDWVYSLNPDCCNMIATISRNASTEEDDANAKLIAASPELLEALQGMVKRFTDLDPGDDDGVSDCPELVQARKAIAKALGTE